MFKIVLKLLIEDYMITYLILSFFIGVCVGAIIFHLIDYPPRFSAIKRYLPWVKPCKVIPVDFKAKVRRK